MARLFSGRLRKIFRKNSTKVEPFPPPPLSNDTLRLNLGCNQNPKPEYINVDFEKYPGVDFVADLNKRWPWQDDSIDEIVAHDILEHLPSIVHSMNEAWRILHPGGRFDVSVPSTDGRGAFQDPTHISFWNENTFLYFLVGHPFRGIYPNLVRARFQSVSLETTQKDALGVCWVQAVLLAVK